MMNILILIFGILLGIILMKAYLFFKKEKEISSAKVNDIVITKDNKVGILVDYHMNFDYPDIDDELIYEIKDIHTNLVQAIGKSMVYCINKNK